MSFNTLILLPRVKSQIIIEAINFPLGEYINKSIYSQLTSNLRYSLFSSISHIIILHSQFLQLVKAIYFLLGLKISLFIGLYLNICCKSLLITLYFVTFVTLFNGEILKLLDISKILKNKLNL